jgi:lipopolysaccharide/colanic/teichoic acid biosynthesis glycosyltransferase
LIKPGLTGLAQLKLGYDGTPHKWSRQSQALGRFLEHGATSLQAIDGLAPKTFSNKLLYDLAYSAMLEDPWECLKTDLVILAKTPAAMVLGIGL